MRYSLMLQIVASTTLVLLSVGALFAWMQNRPQPGSGSPASEAASAGLAHYGLIR